MKTRERDRKWKVLGLGFTVVVLFLSGCSQAAENGEAVEGTSSPAAPLVDPAAPPTAEPPRSLFVCLYEEPNSLYRYGNTNRAADAVLEAIYDGPIDNLGFEPQPVILEKLPSLADGDVRIEPVSLSTGDVHLNPETQKPETLSFGDIYLPSGCGDSSCFDTYRGGQVDIDRMTAVFRILPGLTWPDGQPVTAADSRLSFELDSAPETPTTKFIVDRTFSYEAIDEQTLQWSGIAGFMDDEVQTNFWPPMPSHQLAEFDALSLQTADESAKTPIGWGPYVIDEWREGVQIELSPNPNYFRAGQVARPFDTLVFRFVDPDPTAAVQQILTGECDVLDELPLDRESLEILNQQRDAGTMAYTSVPGSVLERIELNLFPSTFGQPFYFDDPRTRQGLAACIDRRAIIDEVLGGLAGLSDTYLSPAHPLYPADLQTPPPGIQSGSALLQEAGWTDGDNDASTPRIAFGVSRVADGTPLSFRYTTTPGFFREEVADRIAADLALCGADAELEIVESSDFFGAWPEGLMFGRNYEAAAWAWPIFNSPPCEMFDGREIANFEKPIGINAAGFDDPFYNAACSTILVSRPDIGYEDAVRLSQITFAENQAAIPLYLQPRVVPHSTDFCGLELDPSSLTVFWNIENFKLGESCPNF